MHHSIMQCTVNQGNWQIPYSDIKTLLCKYSTETEWHSSQLFFLTRLTSTRRILNPSRIYACLLNIDRTTRKRSILKHSFYHNCVEYLLNRNDTPTFLLPFSWATGGKTFSFQKKKTFVKAKGALSTPNRKFLLPLKTIRYDWCLNKTCVSVYKFYEMYSHRRKIVQLLVF